MLALVKGGNLHPLVPGWYINPGGAGVISCPLCGVERVWKPVASQPVTGAVLTVEVQ